ncbi:hypothetical protein BUALT_Bualt11G0066000 [Buddleja alternifolia]|uniref:BZIP domain-containing protein n=1 Tax=Buddleja alternifolia TaxID=168488 RepID=A0AAV6X3W2_9LAMI|nr:hypothetical protein BUALT_Bualt11G0066000 [Buddleja alternifolia]
MLSTFPATLFSESSLGNLFPPFETSFSSWDSPEPPFLFHPPPQDNEPIIFNTQASPEPVTSNSGSYTSNPVPVTPYSGSDEPNRKKPKNVSSGSDDTSGLGSIIDERKRRRMESNRESARRSRMRKQEHLEKLRNQLNRLEIENRELMNRTRLVVHKDGSVRRENELLRWEAVMLRQRLRDIRQVLIVRQHFNTSAWPCNDFTSINECQLPNHSLIT